MARDNVVELMHCPKCNLTKEISNFRVRGDTGKRRPICNACWSARCKLYNSRRDPDHVRAFSREYYQRKVKHCPEYAARRRVAKVRSLYGLTSEEYAALQAYFDNRCGICGSPPKRGNLHVDHCHDTKEVRGLLCRSCNMAIGKLGDSVEGLERALRYLRHNWREKIAA